jgi:hypothetical protein
VLNARPSGQSAEPEALVLRDAANPTPSDWLGGTILLDEQGAGGHRVIVALDRRSGTRTPVSDSAFGAWHARWSADGRWIAYISDESGQPEAYVQPWPSGTPRVRATFGGAERAQWGGGRALYFSRDDTIMRALVSGSPRATVSTPERVASAPGLRDFSVDPRSGRLLVIETDSGPVATPAAGFLILEWPSLVPPPPQAPPKL